MKLVDFMWNDQGAINYRKRHKTGSQGQHTIKYQIKTKKKHITIKQLRIYLTHIGRINIDMKMDKRSHYRQHYLLMHRNSMKNFIKN